MPKDVQESLNERKNAVEKFLEDLKKRNEISSQIIDLQKQTEVELEILQAAPGSKREEANVVLGPEYERSAALAQQLTGPIGPTGVNYRNTISGATGPAVSLLDYSLSCVRSDSFAVREWGEFSITRMAQYEQESNKRSEISKEFQRVDTELADKFERAYESGLKALNSLEQPNHAANDFRNTIQSIKGRLLDRLRKVQPGMKESWNSIDSVLQSCTADVPTAADLVGKLMPFFDRVSTILKVWQGTVPTKPEVAHLWGTFIEICQATALLFAEFDSIYI